VVDRAKEIFTWFGKPEQTSLSEVPGPHTYNEIQRARGVVFSTKWLLGKDIEVQPEPIDSIEPELLGALGGINGEHPVNINDIVYEKLLPAWEPRSPASLAAWNTRRAELSDKLNNIVLRNMPKKFAPVKTPAGGRDAFLLESEPGIKIGMISYTPETQYAPDGARAAVIYVSSPGETWGHIPWGFMKPFPLEEVPTTRVMIYPRGIGTEIWNDRTEIKYKRDAFTLGRTLDDMRLADILAAVEAVATDPANAGIEQLTLIGKGRMSVLAAYAALLDERVTRVVLHSPTTTHLDGPHLLNVLRFTDLPETLGMLAPRCELVFLTHEIDKFDLTRKIYELNEAGKKFRRAVSPAQAINLPE
jgi:hypothetical protein